MIDPLNINPVRQQSDWYAEREKFRRANEEKVHRLLHPVMVPYRHIKLAIWAICDHGKMILRNEWQLTLFKNSTQLLYNLERHSMEDMPKPILGTLVDCNREQLAEQLSSQAHNSVLLDSVTIPGGEDYDGPPIYDLDNEEEILAVTEAMIKSQPKQK